MKQKLAYSAYDLEKLGLGSRQHIYRMMDRNEVPYVKLGNRKVVPKWWVDKFFTVQNLEGTSSEDEVQLSA
jgi:hypothetical protein